jgi:hypothetical protein
MRLFINLIVLVFFEAASGPAKTSVRLLGLIRVMSFQHVSFRLVNPVELYPSVPMLVGDSAQRYAVPLSPLILVLTSR